MMIRVATRGSRLALAQAQLVKERLEAEPGVEVETVLFDTMGDRVLDTPLPEIGDKGLFTRELEAALLDGTVDAAVHSLKDLPTALPAGLGVLAVMEREDPRDAILSRSGALLADLPRGARIGTSSLRRQAQLRALRPDLEIADLRGNVPTRIAKLDRGDYDAILAAYAGLRRLGLEARATEVLELDVMIPAAGQGAIAVEGRTGDTRIAEALARLDHRDSRLEVAAERALLAKLEGGCQVPIGALGRVGGGGLTLHALVADVRGETVIRDRAVAPAATEAEARALGIELAQRLLDRGAGSLLAGVRSAG